MSDKSDPRAILQAVKRRKAEENLPPKKDDKPKITSREISDALYMGEQGDGLLFVRLHRGGLAFDHAAKCWMRWGGHHWSLDKTDEHFARVDDLIALYQVEMAAQHARAQEAMGAGNDDEQEAAEKMVKRLRGRIFELRKIAHRHKVLEFASKGDESLAITGDEWDRDPWLFACPNGVLNLKTAEFSPGRPDDYCHTSTTVPWIDTAECPTWKAFLWSCFENQAVIDYLQRLVGYAMIGRVTEHVLPILWGKGRNGKGVFVETMRLVFGGYAYPLPSELLLEQSRSKNADGPSPTIMAMRGKRLVWASETEEGRRFSATMVKWLSGGDTIVGRSPYGKRTVEFSPSHLFMLLTNHRPHASADDDAFWKRMALIHFPFQFVEKPDKPHHRPINKHLAEELTKELPGILRWALDGCMEWQRLGGLEPPDAVLAATKDYQADEDLVGQFIEQRCVLGEPRLFKIRAGDLYKAYERWSEEMGVPKRSQKKFGPILVEKGFAKEENTYVYYLGIALRPPADAVET